MAKKSLAQLAAENGFKYLGGSSRKFEDLATGKQLSRRSFEERVLGRETVGQTGANARYNSLAQAYQRKVQQKGEKLTPGQVKRSEDFKKAYAELKKANKVKDKDERQRRLKKALEDIGRRNPEWDWPPGETPD